MRTEQALTDQEKAALPLLKETISEAKKIKGIDDDRDAWNAVARYIEYVSHVGMEISDDADLQEHVQSKEEWALFDLALRLLKDIKPVISRGMREPLDEANYICWLAGIVLQRKNTKESV